MKRKLFISSRRQGTVCGAVLGSLVLGLLAAACLLTGCGKLKGPEVGEAAVNSSAQADPEENVLFRLAETMPESHPSAKATKHFAELVEKESLGRIRIMIYYDEELGTPQEIIEQMKFGGIAMARVNSLELSDAIPALRQYLRPEKYTGAGNQIESFRKSEEILRNTCQLEKITPLAWYYPDLRCVYSSNRVIESREDLKGTKVKATECRVMKDIMEELGAEAVGVTGANLYRSLSSGDIQYAESGFCEFICRDYGKYIHYVTVTDYAYFPDVMLVNTESLNSLSPSEKEILKECARETYEYQKKEMLAFKEHWTDELEKNDKVEFREKAF